MSPLSNKVETAFEYKFFIILITVMAVVMFPRFDRIDRFGLDAYTTEGEPATVALADAGKYVNNVRWYRGEVDASELREPWAYRHFPTLVASLLPFKPMTAINVTNYLFLSLGLFFLIKTLRLMNHDRRIILLGAIGWVVSFPVFFYGAIGYIDPILVGMMSVGMYLILTKRDVFFFSVLVVAAFVKDAYIIILPAWFMFQVMQTDSRPIRAFCISVLALLAFVILILLIRKYTPVSSGFFWVPNQEMLDFNLYRPRAWITWILTFSPFVFLASWFCIQQNFKLLATPVLISCAAGLAGAWAILIYSYFTVHMDGRYVWIAYPFAIPLACEYFNRRVSTLR